MLTCPNPPCRKPIPPGARECPRCRTDLSLLVTYVEDLHGGLERAEALTRAGELGEAVWTYLQVLEVDPDNQTARQQVGQVVAAVRQFDRAAPGRRWFRRLQRQARFRQWLGSGTGTGLGWLAAAVWLLLALGAFVLGFVLGSRTAPTPAPEGGAATPAPVRMARFSGNDPRERGMEKILPGFELTGRSGAL